MAESKSTSRQSKQPTPDDGVAQELQKIVDDAEDQGYYGVAIDPTPNEHYTVEGVLAGKPTPETDAEHAREVRQKLDDVARER